MFRIVWTDYMRYRTRLRGFDIELLEQILKRSSERYFDVETGRLVVVGRHNNDLVMIPYDKENDTITPVTVHMTTRQQVNFRLKMALRYSMPVFSCATHYSNLFNSGLCSCHRCNSPNRNHVTIC